MALWDNKQYDEEGTRIAKVFAAGEGKGGASLTDLVEKTARAEGLNPEQVRRLTRVSNIRAWEQKFAGMKTAGATDRNVEFALGDENEVIRRLHGEAAAMVSAAVKTASALHGPEPEVSGFPDLPDAMDAVRRPVPKESGEFAKSATETPVLASRRPDLEVLKLQRMGDEIAVKVAAEKQAWAGALQALLDESHKVSWTPDAAADFEKAAVALHGLDVVPEINALRRLRGEGALVLTNEKVAALRDRLYAEPSRATDLVKAAAVARKQYAVLGDAARAVEQKLAYFRGQMGLRRVAGTKG